jgi:hypothetical protein
MRRKELASSYSAGLTGLGAGSSDNRPERSSSNIVDDEKRAIG